MVASYQTHPAIAQGINVNVRGATTDVPGDHANVGVQSETMAQLNPRSFVDATQLGDGVYELILSNWGNRGAKQDPNNGSISYPPVKSDANGAVPIEGQFTLPPLPGLAAIAIAPRSTVDRCVLHYSSLAQTPPELTPVDSLTPASIATGFVQRGLLLESEQILAVESPLIGQLVGPIVIRAHETSYFSDAYIKNGDNTATLSTFGTALPRSASNALIWHNPELRLLLYLQGRVALPPTKRAPLHLGINSAFTANVEELVAVVPVVGRKRIRVQYRAAGVGASIRATGVQWLGEDAVGPAWVTNRNFEYPLIGATPIVANSTVILSIDNPGISFLLLYATPSAPILIEPICVTFDAFD